LLAKVKENLEVETKTYDAYLSGNVVGYVIKNSAGEITDSCWGYYSEADAIAEAKSTVDFNVQAEWKAKLEKIKAFIKNRVPLEARLPGVA
jgi:hypothetical protein